MVLYCIDIESTGVDFKNDRIIQLAVVKVENENIEVFDDLCYKVVPLKDYI